MISAAPVMTKRTRVTHKAVKVQEDSRTVGSRSTYGCRVSVVSIAIAGRVVPYKWPVIKYEELTTMKARATMVKYRRRQNGIDIIVLNILY